MRKITLRDRINYHLSFSMAERIERAKDKACLWIARRMPERLGMWTVVARHAAVTSGEHGNRHPGDVKAFDLYGKAA